MNRRRFRVVALTISITSSLVVLPPVAWLRVTKDDRENVRARLAELSTAYHSWDTNAIYALLLPSRRGEHELRWMSALLGNSIRSPAPYGTVVVVGGAATVRPAGAGHRGFPIGDNLDLVKTNGVWYFTGTGGLD